MREGIHPDYKQTTITCACGEVIETGSTKENIRKAVLSNPQTSEYVRIISDGKQHVRCWKVEDGFCLLVADYSNAGSDTFLSSHAAVDYRPLKSGERVKGQCRVTVHAVK